MRQKAARALAVLTVCLAGPLSAQQLRGAVRDSASGQPVPGAVLVLLDSTGRALGRNITNEQGQYVIALVPSIHRMQVLRIGFRPRTVRVPPDVRGALQLDVTMASIPMLLPTVSVVDQPNCPRRPDRPAAFALWEQAKSALLATVVAREANPAEVLRLHFARRVDDHERTVFQSVRIDSTETSRTFVASRSAAEFVEQGFSYDSAGSRWYHGPDADVMLDAAFALGYCFEIAAADPARSNEIGLAFKPANTNRRRIDIEGAVWIDSVSRSLTDIVFRYVGVSSRAARRNPGGRVSFRSMGNGSVIIDRWFLRFASPIATPGRVRTFSEVADGPLEVRETGGEVAHARWADGREWQAVLGTVRGRVIGQAGAGTIVQLVETDYSAVADSTGSFQISNLLPGPYSIGAVDARLGDLGILLKTTAEFTAARGTTTDIAFDVPTADAYLAAKCEADARSLTNAVLVARVLMPDGSPAEAAKVEVRAVRDGSLRQLVEGETDRMGLFHLCHAPRGIGLQIRAERGGLAPAMVIKEVTGRLVTAKLQLRTANPR